MQLQLPAVKEMIFVEHSCCRKRSAQTSSLPPKWEECSGESLCFGGGEGENSRDERILSWTKSWRFQCGAHLKLDPCP